MSTGGWKQCDHWCVTPVYLGYRVNTASPGRLIAWFQSGIVLESSNQTALAASVYTILDEDLLCLSPCTKVNVNHWEGIVSGCQGCWQRVIPGWRRSPRCRRGGESRRSRCRPPTGPSTDPPHSSCACLRCQLSHSNISLLSNFFTVFWAPKFPLPSKCS